jgi:hypothetical protein
MAKPDVPAEAPSDDENSKNKEIERLRRELVEKDKDNRRMKKQNKTLTQQNSVLLSQVSVPIPDDSTAQLRAQVPKEDDGQPLKIPQPPGRSGEHYNLRRGMARHKKRDTA